MSFEDFVCSLNILTKEIEDPTVEQLTEIDHSYSGDEDFASGQIVFC